MAWNATEFSLPPTSSLSKIPVENFGIDFTLRYHRNLSPTFGELGKIEPGWTYFDSLIAFDAEGFLTISEEENKRNSLTAEGKFGVSGFYTSRSAAAAGQSGSPLPIDPDVDPSSLSELISHLDSEWWVFGFLTAKYETTQDFEDYDFAVGTELAVTSGPLAKVLDLPFRLLRAAERNNPRHLDLVVGLDYVTQLDQTANAALRAGDDDAFRAYAAVEWSTGIFTERQRLALRYEASYELDPPSAIEQADLDFNHFFEARLQHLLIGDYGTNATYATLKYSTGELAPNYENENLLGAGFTIEF